MDQTNHKKLWRNLVMLELLHNASEVIYFWTKAVTFIRQS